MRTIGALIHYDHIFLCEWLQGRNELGLLQFAVYLYLLA